MPGYYTAPSSGSGGSGTPAVTPGDVAGLVLWLRPEELAALAEGDPIASWTDAGPDVRTVAQATTGSKPTYRANALNGHGVVEFDGVDDYLHLSSSVVAGATGLTFMAVARLDDATGYPQIVSWPSTVELRFSNSTGELNITLSTGQSVSTAPFHDGLWHTFAGDCDDASGRSMVHADGLIVGQANSCVSSWVGGNLGIGARADGTLPFKGRIAEIAAFKRLLTPRELRGILAGWDTKFDV